MERARQVTLSAAVFVLVCFFMPWVQISCGGLRDSASGLDLARGGDRALWLMPLLMCLLIFAGLARAWKKQPTAFALLGIVSAILTAYLMNREREDAERASGIIGARVTGWLWLGLFSSLAVAISALLFYLKRSKSP